MERRAGSKTGERIAIIIGCKKYQSPSLNNLEYAEKDARAIEEIFSNSRIGGFEKIYAFDSSSTLMDINVKIEKVLASTLGSDTVVIYFSGHGIKHPQNRQLYLAINETRKETPISTAISANKLLEQFEACRATSKCVILDCCYSGTFGRKSDSIEMLDYNEDLVPHKGKGVFVLTSSKGYEESLESPRHSHSLFTHYLLEGMGGAADKDGDGVITPSELYDYTHQRVTQETLGEMTPDMPINRLDGPEFYLVQNPRNEEKLLKQWQQNIEQLQSKHHHLKAIETLQKSIRKHGDHPAPIAQKLILFQQQVEENLCQQWRAYLVRLNQDWSQGLISRDLKDAAEQHVNGDPEFMFSESLPNENNPLTLDLRQHFKNDISSRALNERWPRSRLSPISRSISVIKHEVNVNDDSEDTQPVDSIQDGAANADNEVEVIDTGKSDLAENTVNDVIQDEHSIYKTIVKQLRQWAPLTAGISIILLVVIFLPSNTSSFNPVNIQFGINARSLNWDQSGTDLMNAFRNELNLALKEKGSIYKLSATSVKRFEKKGASFKELSDALQNGEIDILGELSPREIYILNEDVGLTPFIGPKHSVDRDSQPESTYRTLLFGLAENYSRSKYMRPGELIGEIIQQQKIVVAGKDSTSGYWWPRSWVLGRLNESDKLSFDAASIVQLDKRGIIKKVICDSKNITAGALAEFRFKQLVNERGEVTDKKLKKMMLDCGAPSSTKLRIIDVIQDIPNGAYVLGSEAASQPGLNHDLNDVWEPAIKRLFDRAHLCQINPDICDLKLTSGSAISPDKIKKYLPEQWLLRDLDTYTRGAAKKVFSAEDPAARQQSRIIFGLLLICAVILVLGLAAATLLRRSQTNAQSPES